MARCGTYLYQILIFAPLVTLIRLRGCQGCSVFMMCAHAGFYLLLDTGLFILLPQSCTPTFLSEAAI